MTNKQRALLYALTIFLAFASFALFACDDINLQADGTCTPPLILAQDSHGAHCVTP